MNEDHDRYLLGIDIGTTGAKCTVYDTGGCMVGHAYQEYPMIHPHEGWTPCVGGTPLSKISGNASMNRR